MSRRAVWKYAIDLARGDTTTEFQIPEGARFLYCAAQGESIGLWFEVPVGETRTQQRGFRIFGTGEGSIDAHLSYVGTAMFSDGAFVFHVYEVDYS